MSSPNFQVDFKMFYWNPPAVHCISYHTCWTLHTALKKALHDDEYEELKESKLGVFIKFQELGFYWASRLVHYILGFQLDIKKKYELWSLLTSFWEMLGVHVEAEPSTQEIITTFERCEGWSRDDRKWLAYLAIFTGYIEGRKYSTPTRVSLARLVMELERFENYLWGRVAFKVLMDSMKEKDISGRKQFKEAILSQLEDFPDDLIIIHILYLLQTRVINFVQKDIGEMFPKWEFDAEDTPAENIIKLIFKNVVKEDSPRPRKKARKEAPAEASEEATVEASEEAPAEARSEVITTVGGLTKEDIKTMFKDIVNAMREGFGTCLKEIKYLSERVEAVEKKVGITTKRKGTSSQNIGTWTSSQNTTSPPKKRSNPWLLHLLCFLYCMDFVYSETVNGTNAGRESLSEDKGPDVPADASSSKDKAPEPSLVLLDKNQSTVSDLQKEDARYQEKRDAALALYRAKSDRTRRLAASQQSPYTENNTAK
ncbi:unnamed protein product, partial [Brassica oleracea var. botrytis]